MKSPKRFAGFARFLLLAFLLLGGGYLYLGLRLVRSAGLAPALTIAAWAALALPFLAITWLPLVHWRKRGERPGAADKHLVKVSYLSLGLLSFLAFASGVRDVALGLLFAVGAPAALAWLAGAKGAGAVVIAAGSMVLWAHYESRRTPRVREVWIPVADLAPQLEGFRIAQISDLHVGHSVRRPFVERVVTRINALEADVVALTGDIVDGSVTELAPDVAPLAGLRAREGCYYVTGNHEYYWGAREWTQAIARMGITPLVDEHRVIERDGARLLLAGVPDYWGERSPLALTKAGERARLPEAAFRVLLAHQPKSAFEAAARGFDLQLCGHTHGGQFLPWTFAIRYFQPFVHGLNRCGKMWLYVSRGTGSWGPPLRLGAPSEITLLVLTHASKVKRPRVRKSLPLPDAA